MIASTEQRAGSTRTNVPSKDAFYAAETTKTGLMVHRNFQGDEDGRLEIRQHSQVPLQGGAPAIPPRGAFSVTSSPVQTLNKNGLSQVYSHSLKSPKHSSKKMENMRGKNQGATSTKGFKKDAVKYYKNAMLTPKSKEPSGFMRSSPRFGHDSSPIYSAPATQDYVKATTKLDKRKASPEHAMLSATYLQERHEKHMSKELSLYEQRNSPDRQTVEVRTAQTVLTAPRERQYRHPREMEQKLIILEKRNSELRVALRETRLELKETKVALDNTQTSLENSKKKEQTLLILVQEVLSKWAKKKPGLQSFANQMTPTKISAKLNAVMGERASDERDSEAVSSANEKGRGIHDQIDEKIDTIEALLLAP